MASLLPTPGILLSNTEEHLLHILLFMLHASHADFLSCLQVPLMELLYIRCPDSNGQTQAPVLSLQTKQANDFTCCDKPVSFACLLLWKVAAPDEYQIYDHC